MPFETYVKKEISRLADGEKAIEKQCRLLFETQPRLEVPLMLSALCTSMDAADDLFEYVRNMPLSEEHETHRRNVLGNWKELLSELQLHDEREVREVLLNANGDEMERIGFPVSYAKYADVWYFWQNREALDRRLNDTYRRKYRRLLKLGDLTVDDCISVFDENFPRFIDGEFDYPFEVLKSFDV